ncbi:hypothetical protein [Legionella cardiaca]|uniref:Uncharacterized protein n=1 Tax=Legionella cardiaca TaxID=1071983 RepID=A0ABY8AMW3_9GAMM|nr:hypothetical protein [Legionella cardiaca]WED41987.1 hypothetical protein PXX05_08565 [Legionella cardiaca]
MKHKHVTQPQTVNACTLISIAAIQAILSAQNEKEMEHAVVKAHYEFQQCYQRDFGNAYEHGEGLLEEAAYQRYFSESFPAPKTTLLAAPASDKTVATIIANRDGYLYNGTLDLEFYTFNLDLIEAIEKKLPPGSPAIDWATISASRLKQLVNTDEKPPLDRQAAAVITSLQDPQGITLRMDGHTISLVKRAGVYYSYDSLTGILSSTAESAEIIEHVARKIDTNKAKGIAIYFFTPQLGLTSQEKNSTLQQSNPPEINAEAIHNLIKNRDSFDETEDGFYSWQQANSELIEAIFLQLDENKKFAFDWRMISEQELCALLNLEYHEKNEKKTVSVNQNCAEAMIIKAAQLVLKRNIQFQYSKITPDSQVDISPAFLFSEDKEKQYWISGDKKQNLENDLKKLDKNKVYFLRTGTNGGPGHWQTLYFDKAQNGWIIYSSEINNIQLTQGNSLTQRGLGLLSPFAKWGHAQGEYCLLLVKASPKNIINAANYLYDYRMFGEENAETNSWVAKNDFYPQISVDEELPLDNTAKLITILKTLKGNIANQQNGRKTARNSAWKIALLTQIQNRLDSDNLEPDLDQYIQDIREVCKIKRNSFHFWSEPHSVSEFEHLLGQQFPEQSHTKLLTR